MDHQVSPVILAHASLFYLYGASLPTELPNMLPQCELHLPAADKPNQFCLRCCVSCFLTCPIEPVKCNTRYDGSVSGSYNTSSGTLLDCVNQCQNGSWAGCLAFSRQVDSSRRPHCPSCSHSPLRPTCLFVVLACIFFGSRARARASLLPPIYPD